jgi:hypothetical protein
VPRAIEVAIGRFVADMARENMRTSSDGSNAGRPKRCARSAERATSRGPRRCMATYLLGDHTRCFHRTWSLLSGTPVRSHYCDINSNSNSHIITSCVRKMCAGHARDISCAGVLSRLTAPSTERSLNRDGPAAGALARPRPYLPARRRAEPKSTAAALPNAWPTQTPIVSAAAAGCCCSLWARHSRCALGLQSLGLRRHTKHGVGAARHRRAHTRVCGVRRDSADHRGRPSARGVRRVVRAACAYDRIKERVDQRLFGGDAFCWVVL